MKQLLPCQAHNGFKALILLCLLQHTAHRANAQEQVLNTNVNDVYNNVNVSRNQSLNNRNVNAPIPTGPNGSGFVPDINVNVPVIDNGLALNTGGPNVRGYTSSLIVQQNVVSQAANKPKTTRPAAVKTVKPKGAVVAQRPKPKPKATVAAPKRTVARPAAPVVAAPAVTEPLQVAVSNPAIGTGNQLAVVDQMMNTDHNTMVQSNVLSDVQAPVINTGSAPAVRSSTAPSGSGSSGKSHRSGRKKHGSFYYNTNKKMMKLFAKTKNRTFDPAKCFVWK